MAVSRQRLLRRTFTAGVGLALLVGCGATRKDHENDSSASSGGAGSGGSPVTGGATASGGAGTGGAATGGTSSGGTAPTTGGTTTGGATTGGASVGGALTGGAATGGAQTGGSSSGGALTGGASTGGATSGGAPSGGTDTGGAPAGGATTGGAGTGGAQTGGAQTGGAQTGGAQTGGAQTGGAQTGGAQTGGAAGAGSGGAPTTCSYLQDFPADAAPDAVGLKLAQLFASQASDGTRHYKEACGWYGALMLAGLLEEQSLMTSLINRYDPYRDAYASLFAGTGSVDENVWGIVPAEIYLQNSDAQCLADALAIADHQQRNSSAQIRHAVDDMFMMTGLQVQAYRASGDPGYLHFMAPIMVDYLGDQLSDGLFIQLPRDTGTESHKWSRGNGWFASGLTEMLRELDPGHADHATIRHGYERMMEGLLDYQIQSGDGAGLWRQVIDDAGTGCFAETSGSAMFTNAMVTGIKNGWLDCETYGPAARSAWIALVSNLQGDGRMLNISDWMYGGTVSEYCSRGRVTGDNHGQAPMMWTAAALLR